MKVVLEAPRRDRYSDGLIPQRWCGFGVGVLLEMPGTIIRADVQKMLAAVNATAR